MFLTFAGKSGRVYKSRSVKLSVLYLLSQAVKLSRKKRMKLFESRLSRIEWGFRHMK